MPTFDPIRRFLVVPAVIDAEGNKVPSLPTGVENWVGTDVLPDVFVIMTTDDIVDPPRAYEDFDPIAKAREIRDAKKEDLPNILAVRMNNDASDAELDAVQTEMGVSTQRKLSRVDVNSWQIQGQ